MFFFKVKYLGFAVTIDVLRLRIIYTTKNASVNTLARKVAMAGTGDAEAEAPDEHRIKRQIQDTACGQHIPGELCSSVRPDEVCQDHTHERRDSAEYEHPDKIVFRIDECVFVGAEQPQDRLAEQSCGQRQEQCRGKRGIKAECAGALCVLFILFAQRT